MPTLLEVLTDPSKKDTVIEACCQLIDAEVKDKGGISGLALKAGYSAVKGIKPGFIRHAVDDMLPEFASALDPLYQEGKSKGKAAVDFFGANTPKVADALLAITDARATTVKSGVVKGTYDKLRGTAKKHVEAAVPRLAKLIDTYAP